MNEFPPTFRLETFKQQILDGTTAYGAAQLAMLAVERGKIVSNVEAAGQAGAREVLIQLPDQLCGDMKLKLATELLERFPGHVQYRYVIEYADVDQFREMKEPRACFDYKIIF
jgi:hypothetical protein